MVKVNGELLDIAGRTLAEYLEEGGFDVTCIAVEHCGEIVPKAQYDRLILQDGDNLEVVRFVGGG